MDFQEWFESLPKFTRTFMIGVLATSILITYYVAAIPKLVLTWEGIFDNYYIWSIFTNYLVFGKLSFSLLMQLFLMYRILIMIKFRYYALSSNEKYHTPNKYADFVYMILVNMLLVWVYSLVLDLTAFMGAQLVYSVLYVYCKREPLLMVTFLFGFKFKNANFPWVLLIYELLTGASIERTLVGIAAGHTYIVLKDILPSSQYKYNFLQTPKFLQNLVTKYGPSFPQNNFGAAPNQNQQFRPRPAFFGGHGHRLG